MKNQRDILVPAGRWKICGFRYSDESCDCCGRRIVRCFSLQNLTHEMQITRDPSYKFSEVITVGSICCPKVFAESCKNFYENPDMEWARQFAVYKDYVKYVLLCKKSADIWRSVPEDLRVPVDEFLDGKWKLQTDEKNTGLWWQVRDAKRSVLNSKRTSNRQPVKHSVDERVKRLRKAAINLGVIPGEEKFEHTTQEAVKKNVA